jgi:hypothetical protein
MGLSELNTVWDRGSGKKQKTVRWMVEGRVEDIRGELGENPVILHPNPTLGN